MLRVKKCKPAVAFICDHCGTSCSRYFNLQRHCKNFHDIILKNKKDIKKPERGKEPNNFKSKSESYSCPIKGCDFVGYKTRHFDLHFTNDHPDLEIDKKELTFQNAEKFKTWKSTVEKQSNCRFVIHTGRKSKYEYYYCHRSGQFKSSSTGKRSLKTQGSCKFGSYCPAKICARISDCRNFNVTFVSTHVGHKHDLAHLPTSFNTKKQSARKMLGKIPDNIIIEEVRESVTDDVQGEHLSTEQDMYNIPHELETSLDDSYEIENEDTRDDDVEWRKHLLLFKEIQEMTKTPEDDAYFYTELMKLKNHFLKNSAVPIRILSTPNEDQNKKKFKNKTECGSKIPQHRLYSPKKRNTSKSKKTIEESTLVEKAAVISVNFPTSSFQRLQKVGNVILISAKDLNKPEKEM